MKDTIEERELFVLDGLGVVTRGTYHKTPLDMCGAQPNLKADRMGVLFVSSLFPTRAGNGDSAVYWADAFAAMGYPSFRLDSPGFGDSGGDPPPELFEFINRGGYADCLSAKIKELAARYHLSGVVLVGLCAGAVSAVWAAAASKDCRGIILMNPYFHLPLAERPSYRKKLSAWSLRTRLGGVLSGCFALVKEIRLLLNRQPLPKNANQGLLRRFMELASAGLPTLILVNKDWKTPGMKSKTGEFDYLSHVLNLTRRKGCVVVTLVEGANHSLSNRAGRLGAKEHAEHWLESCFPVSDPANMALSGERPVLGGGKSACAYQEQVLNCDQTF